MSGWVPVPARDWWRQRLHITAPWPEVLVVLDLRFWADAMACDGRPRPSLRTLAATWGWGRRRTAKWLDTPKLWADEGRTTVRPERGQREATATPRDAVQSETISEDEATVRPERGQREATATPRLKGTHAQSPSPTPSPSSSDEEEDSLSATTATTAKTAPTTATGPPVEANRDTATVTARTATASTTTATAWDRCNDIIRDEICPTLGRPYRKLSPSKGMGLSLRARITDHGVDDIIRLLRWYATSDHERARFLRSGGHWLKTLLRSSNCEEYLGMLDGAEPGPSGEWTETDEEWTPEMEAEGQAVLDRRRQKRREREGGGEVIPFRGGSK